MKKLPYLFKKPLKALSLFLLFLPLLVSCSKEKLTKPTQTGANTFSCKINGKVYVAKTNLFSPGLTGGLGGAPGRYEFSVEAVVRNDADKASYTIGLFCGPGISEGLYPISYGSVDYNNGNYTSYSLKPGTINFTHIDYVQHIISGTFSFTAVNTTNSSDILTVTEGRFDMKN